MKTSYFKRLLTAIVAILSMLFMQLAVASYACPGKSAGSSMEVSPAATMVEEMPDCDVMDPEQSALHCVGSHWEKTIPSGLMQRT